MAVVLGPCPEPRPMDIPRGEDFAPLGVAHEVRDLLNAWFAAARLDIHGRDDRSGVDLPAGVAAIDLPEYGGLVRMVWITRPTHEVLEVIWRHGRAARGWRIFDAGSEYEYTEADFR